MKATSRGGWRELWREHGQTIVNVVVFLGIGRYVVVYTLDKWEKGILWDFVEVAFLVHNLILLALILIRQPHRAMEWHPFHQAVALAAFFSGLLYRDAITESRTLLLLAQVVTGFALVLGTAALLNLGRSFGILIAIRTVKTNGLYAIVRHPMYFTDIVWKVGVFLKKPCWFNVGIMVFAISCYLYRAILEEKFLSQYPEYREYTNKVKYRLIPGLF